MNKHLGVSESTDDVNQKQEGHPKGSKPTFLWAGRHHLSSSAQWELGRHGLHT